MIHTVKGFSIVHEAEAYVFLEASFFFYYPIDVSTLIPSSSAFHKSSLNIWAFSVHVLLKPRLENFKHYFASMWNVCEWCSSLNILWHVLLWDWSEKTFPVLWLLLSFPNLLDIECSTLTASSLRIWNSSAEITSPPLALFIVMLPKTHLILHSRISGSRWLITLSWFSGSLRSFFV